MNTEKKETEMTELNLEELEAVNGGWWPVIIIGAAAAYCFYNGIRKGMESDWK